MNEIETSEPNCQACIDEFGIGSIFESECRKCKEMFHKLQEVTKNDLESRDIL